MEANLIESDEHICEAEIKIDKMCDYVYENE